MAEEVVEDEIEYELVHNSSYHPESNLKGEKIGCWSVGCLCTLAPDYDPHNTKHNQGFAIITTRENCCNLG